MLNITLLKNILIISIASSIISTSLIQRIKEGTKCKKHMCTKCFLISMIIGILFSLSFTDLKFYETLWVGLISFIGADAVYKTFEDKIFKSLSNIDDVITIERSDKSWYLNILQIT